MPKKKKSRAKKKEDGVQERANNEPHKVEHERNGASKDNGQHENGHEEPCALTLTREHDGPAVRSDETIINGKHEEGRETEGQEAEANGQFTQGSVGKVNITQAIGTSEEIDTQAKDPSPLGDGKDDQESEQQGIGEPIPYEKAANDDNGDDNETRDQPLEQQKISDTDDAGKAGEDSAEATPEADAHEVPNEIEIPPESQDTDSSPPAGTTEPLHKSPNNLIESTPGPFVPIRLHLELPDLGALTYIAHLGDNLFVGTSMGLLLQYTRLPDTQDFILLSQMAFHTSRQSPISKIVPLPSLQVLLVISGHLLQCFSLLDLSPLSIGRIKDVYDVALDWDHTAKCDENGVHVAVLTKQQIRIVNVTKQALRLVKDIKAVAQVMGRRGDKLMVAREQYAIVDSSRELNNQNALFPVNTSGAGDHPLRPFIQGVGKDEFLLVCGTAKMDPAMGLIVNTRGDVSRGTIPMMAYPDDVVVEGEHVFISTGRYINVFSLEDQMEIQSWTFDYPVRLAHVEDEIQVLMKPLRDLILRKSLNGDDETKDKQELEFATRISQVGAHALCYCDDFVELLVPQSRLEKITHIRDVRLLERELSQSRATSEITVVEVEYLNLQISLLRLLTHQYDVALESWTNGSLDPRILIHAFASPVHGEVYIFQGLYPLFQQLHSMIKDTALLNFFEVFLERWLSKESLTDMNVIVSVEETALEYYLKHETRQLMAIIPKLTHIDAVPKLEEERKFLALAKLLAGSEPETALSIYKRLVDGEIVDQDFNKAEALHIICQLSESCHEGVAKEVGLWLLGHDAKLAISFMNSAKISLNSLDTGMTKHDELRHVMNSIDDVSLRYEYVTQMFVGLRREKMKLSLQKGLYRSLLKRLQDSNKKMKVIE